MIRDWGAAIADEMGIETWVPGTGREQKLYVSAGFEDHQFVS
jgi:hypothetical protein